MTKQRQSDPSQLGLIEIQVDRLEFLFDPFDPFPTPTRDLSRAAEDFIVGWARELPLQSAIRLRLHVAHEQASFDGQAALEAAISRHFNYKADRVSGDLRELMAIGRLALLIGMCVLCACIVARQLLLSVWPQGAASGILGEGLVIVGWVANWRPLEIFLYDWWPILRRRKIYQRLAVAAVEIVPQRQGVPSVSEGDPSQVA
jgi:hypothetical protein